MKYLIKIYDMLTILLISMVSITFGILFEYFGIGCIQFVLYSDEAFDIKLLFGVLGIVVISAGILLMMIPIYDFIISPKLKGGK